MKIRVRTGFKLGGKVPQRLLAVVRCCGATGAQTQALAQQTSFAQQMQSQAGEVFGNDSQVYKDLVNSFAQTVANGPSQQGFSAGEQSNLNSQAITNTGAAYRNARQAVGEAQSAQGGGNTGDVSSGSNTGTDLALASGAANQTANELGEIQEKNYEVGRQNYDTAAAGLAGSGNVFSSATGAGSAASNALEGEANTANQIATQQNSWMQAVSGALGAVAGTAVGKLSPIGAMSTGSNKGGGGSSITSVGADTGDYVPQ